jgi:hypothetical protein
MIWPRSLKCLGVLCIAALGLLEVQAYSETLIGSDVVMRASVFSATNPGMEDSFGEIRLNEGRLGQTGAGVSRSEAGTTLSVGFESVPEPAAGLLLAWGGLILAGLGRGSGRRPVSSGLVLILLVGLGALAAGTSALAQTPDDMIYQGTLTDSVGIPLEGPLTLVVRVFDLPSGGTPLYTETHSLVDVDPLDGAFLIRLGMGDTDLDIDGDGEVESNLHPFDATLFLNGPNRYIEVQIGFGIGAEVLAPRHAIGAVPYAAVAADVVADPSSQVGQSIAAAQSAAEGAQAAAEAADGNHTVDTTLTESQVDAYVANNGYLTNIDLAQSLAPEQGDPPTTSHHNVLFANITNPAETQFGYGATFLDPNIFEASPGRESDNQLGAFYNKNGVNGLPTNQFEHAMDSSWELSWRATQTGDHTWLEHNIDLWPPDNRAAISDLVGFNPGVGDAIEFSGGGTGVVIAWNPVTSVLEWRQDYGTVGAGETISHVGSGTAKVGATITSLASTNLWRTRQLEWDTYTNEAMWFWRTRPPTGEPAPLRLINNGVGVGFTGNVGGGTALKVGTYMSNRPTTWMEFQGDTVTGEIGIQPRILDLRYNFAGTGNSYSFASGIRFLSPVVTGTNSLNSMGRRHHIEIWDQRGYGSTSSALYVDAQTCDGCVNGPAAHGNITMRGGNWNDGHYAFGEENASGDHLWRDQTHEVFRVASDSTPSSESDGVALVTGTGASTHGPAFWAISDGSELDTASEVCEAEGVGMAAQSGFDLLAGGQVGAATPIASGQPFIAFCK